MMLENIGVWIKQVILVVIFTVFIDFLMPNNRFLKYAKVLLGLIVMIAIIAPVLSFFNKQPFLPKEAFIHHDLIDNEKIISQAEKLGKKNDELMIKQYKENVNSYICRQVNAISGFEVKNIQAIIEEDSDKEGFGKVSELYLILRKKTGDHAFSTSPQNISIKVNGVQENNSSNKQTNLMENHDELNEIKNFLILQLGILETKIHIKVEG
jgi:stage III sporulation protein AF